MTETHTGARKRRETRRGQKREMDERPEESRGTGTVRKRREDRVAAKKPDRMVGVRGGAETKKHTEARGQTRVQSKARMAADASEGRAGGEPRR